MKFLAMFLFSVSVLGGGTSCYYTSQPQKYPLGATCKEFLCNANIVCVDKGKPTSHNGKECLSDDKGYCPKRAIDCLEDNRVSILDVKTIDIMSPNGSSKDDSSASER